MTIWRQVVFGGPGLMHNMNMAYFVGGAVALWLVRLTLEQAVQV